MLNSLYWQARLVKEYIAMVATVESEVKTIASVQAEIDSAKKELAELQATAMEQVAELMKTPSAPNWNESLRQISIPASNVEKRIERLTNDLAQLKSSSRWEQTVSIRQPVLDTIKSIFIDNPPTVSMSGVRGTIEVVDGKAVVKLTASFKTLDMDAIGSLVASEVDVKAFTQAELTNLVINVSDIGGENKVNITPSGEGLKVKGKRASSGTRAKSKLYKVDGKLLKPTDFLQHLIDIKDTDAMTRIKRYSSGAGGSNATDLAFEAATRLKVEWVEKGTE